MNEIGGIRRPTGINELSVHSAIVVHIREKRQKRPSCLPSDVFQGGGTAGTGCPNGSFPEKKGIELIDLGFSLSLSANTQQYFPYKHRHILRHYKSQRTMFFLGVLS
jgi:hypothetical protein